MFPSPSHNLFLNTLMYMCVCVCRGEEGEGGALCRENVRF